MPRKIKIHASAKLLRTEQGLQHTYDFSAFLIDRRRVEIIDLRIGLWADIMGERACIFAELLGA